MLLEKNVVGKQEDWASFITNVDAHKTPFLTRLTKGDKPTNIVFDYLVDKFEEPVQIAHPDGKDWDTFGSAGKNVARLQALAQEMYVTASVSRKAEDITDVKAINSQLAYEIEKKFVELARITEAQFLSDLDAYRDDGNTGDITRGAGSWISSTAQANYPVPAAYLTPAASIYSSTIALFTEDALRDLLENVWRQTGQSDDELTGIVGPKLKRRISDFQFYIPSSISTQSTARVTNRDQGSKELRTGIDVYDSDFGNVSLLLDNWCAHPNFGGSTGKRNWRGYLLHMNKWQVRWHTQPTVYKPEFKGGSYKAVIDQIVMLVCKNPSCEGKIAPSDATALDAPGGRASIGLETSAEARLITAQEREARAIAAQERATTAQERAAAAQERALAAQETKEAKEGVAQEAKEAKAAGSKAPVGQAFGRHEEHRPGGHTKPLHSPES